MCEGLRTLSVSHSNCALVAVSWLIATAWGGACKCARGYGVRLRGTESVRLMQLSAWVIGCGQGCLNQRGTSGSRLSVRSLPLFVRSLAVQPVSSGGSSKTMSRCRCPCRSEPEAMIRVGGSSNSRECKESFRCRCVECAGVDGRCRTRIHLVYVLMKGSVCENCLHCLDHGEERKEEIENMAWDPKSNDPAFGDARRPTRPCPRCNCKGGMDCAGACRENGCPHADGACPKYAATGCVGKCRACAEG